MKHGSLVYDEGQDRIDIRFGLDDYYRGLHCGETMDVLIDDQWIPTRIKKVSTGISLELRRRYCPVYRSGND